MTRLGLASLVGFLLGGCHGSENCRLRQENARLERENAELRASGARLQAANERLEQENRALARPTGHDIGLMAPAFEPIGEGGHASTRSRRRAARDLLDPFPAADPMPLKPPKF